jgi:hypothetical protein
MPREAKLFVSSSGSAVRGFSKLGKYSTSMDQECSEFAEADRAGDR